MDFWRRGSAHDIETMADHVVLRVRSAARVLTQHYWDKIEGRTEAVRPAGVVLGKTLWVDVALGLDDGPPIDINEVEKAFDSWLKVALERARREVVAFEEVGKGVFRGNFSPGCAAVPLLFSESFNGLELDGGPAVMVPQDDLLLVAGLNDEEAQLRMAEYVQELKIGLPERVSFIPLARDEQDNSWSQLLAERRFDSLGLLREFRLTELVRDYHDQGQALEKLSGSVGVAPYELEPVRKAWPVEAVTRLEEGTEALLPQAEAVLLVPSSGERQKIVDFRQLGTAVQGVFEPQGLIPERYLVRIFPTETQRQRLTDLKRRNPLNIL